MGTIHVSQLGKAYKQYPTRWARLAEWLLPGKKVRHDLKWVLQDVSFTVRPGEAVGIVGINGAGKSTLLKMITGTTQPTTGTVSIDGRVAALLELGMGFHPDFSGRQNAYMAGQLLGHTVQRIDALMPAIEAFAEIGSYIDEPVRIYSSGMQVRLAFSVATAVRPDVLIVDEALSVGDTYFQHKSMDRIRDFAQQGTTLLIVSHDAVAIQALCDRAILLDGGGLAMEGTPQAVMDYYNAMLAERKERQTVRQHMTSAGMQTISGTGEATVVDIKLLNRNGEHVERVEVGETVTLQIQVDVRAPLDRMVLGYVIKDRLGQPMFGTNTEHLDCVATGVLAGEVLTYAFTFEADLGEGTYSVSTAIADTASHLSRNFEWLDLALVFQVVNLSHSPFVGSAFLPARPRVDRHARHAEPEQQAS
ncbi:MAG: ABC transporter ATP-binding protein [Burkholderiales bacterium]|nr:ABC transporter ATP-binding protein [Burkholderiales bacterium]